MGQSGTNIKKHYIVKEGDTIYTLSQKFNLPIMEIRNLNGLRDNHIFAGQRLKVFAKKMYTMKEGDSLASVSLKFGISEGRLRELNRLNKDKQLIISDPIIKYTVQSGDLLESIANRFNILCEELVEYNGLYNRDLFEGENIYIRIPMEVSNPHYFFVLVNKYFTLPSDFAPEDLVVPNIPFPFDYFHEKKLVRKDTAMALEKLFAQAKEDDVELFALSGYRSYGRQKTIFETSVIEEGFESTNKFSAKPGNSEHQTGLAMDVTSPSINYGLDQTFEKTREGQWIKRNAYKFGFILRYIKGKEHITGYEYEPWHIRYVGNNVAEEIYRSGITFEEYLGIE